MKSVIVLMLMFVYGFVNGQEVWRTPLVAKHPSGIFVDGNDNVYGIGNKDYGVSSTSLKDVFLYKLAPNGDSLWVASLDGVAEHQDEGGQIVVDGSGNVYVTGILLNDAASHFDRDVMVAKFGASGNKLWQYDYNGSADHEDVPVKLLLTPSNDVLVGATTRETSGHDISVFKLNAGGSLVWEKHYDNASSADFMIDMTVDANGDLIILGLCDHTGNSEYAPTMIKYDLNGTLLADTVFTASFPQVTFEEYEIPASDMDAMGNAYFYSHRKHTFSNFIYNRQVAIVSVNGIVAIDTLKKPTGIGPDLEFSGNYVVTADNNGDLLIGTSLAVPFTIQDAINYLGKFTSSGSWAFTSTLQVPGNTTQSDFQLYNIGVFANNDILITTDRSWHDGVNFENKLLVSKYTSNGAPVSEHMIMGFSNESGGNYMDQSNLTFDNSGNPVLNISTGPHQLTTLKLDTSLFSNITTSISRPVYEISLNVYPNPTNGNFRVEFSGGPEVDIAVFNSLGKMVWSKSNVSEDQINISLSGHSSGIYFIKAQSDSQQKTIKLIKQ